MTPYRVISQRSAGARFLLSLALSVASAVLVSASACLGATQVSFDTAATIACRDVTTGLFTLDHPDEKLIELPLRVSTLIVGEEQEKIEQLLILVEGPPGRLRVIDYYPSTEVISAIRGPIEIVETTDKNRSLQASVGGGVEFEYGLADVSAKPAASAGTSTKNSVKETYQRRAPKNLLTASGTTNSGHGVFYKLKASDQSTLEGDQPLMIRVAVPLEWRGDWIRIECRAEAYQKHYFEKNLEVVGHRRTLAGLYLMGDAEAEEAAEKLASAQRNVISVRAAKPKKKFDPLRLRSVSRSISRIDDNLEREWHRVFKPNIDRPERRVSANDLDVDEGQQRHETRPPVKKLSPAEELVLAKESLERLSGH